MADLSRSKTAPPTSFHVQDCYVWSEIYYLDSPTNYREYLPPATRRSDFGELTMLDASTSFLRYATDCFRPLREHLLVLMLSALALGFLLAIAVDSF
jgi:hypothetical protein